MGKSYHELYQAQSLPQYTSSVTHSRNRRGTQQQASSCRQVIHLRLCLEEVVGAEDCVGIYLGLCVFRHVYPASQCVCVPVCVCQPSSSCLKQKSPLVHRERRRLKEERTWILSHLTLARSLLANSRQQIRSWELPTALVTGA